MALLMITLYPLSTNLVMLATVAVVVYTHNLAYVFGPGK